MILQHQRHSVRVISFCAQEQLHVHRLEEQGVIIGYTVRLRSDVLEQGVRAITSIGISGHHAAEVKHALRGHPNVVAIHTTNGRWDLMAELRADTLEAFDRVGCRKRPRC